MPELVLLDKTFSKADLEQNPLVKGEYENCVFNNGQFAHGQLGGYKFIDCVFNDCDLSLAQLNRTVWQNVTFRGCKMLGLRFDTCEAFGLSFAFENCQLHHASFYGTKIRKTIFKKCVLHETDFATSDLSGSVFDGCDLTRALFDRSNLEKADFRTSYNFVIDPEINRIKKAKFSLSNISGLLVKYGIHIENNL
ncbi:pentapeptide repeat-containing protein [Olivibacter sitiensis]|uniref:pentapeptide repeat-containing protein n=1 Tax=Olivibacter sitiensis TaxID=376470 RepID=UPI00042547DC|nr:pentapeptide repeat-containing protein [Olivibacter sitiensis]